MALKIVSIAARGCAESTEELNQFLRSHRVVGVERQLIQEGANSYLSFSVEYLERETRQSPVSSPSSGRSSKAKVDCREILSPDDFAAFVKLRDLRKELAAEEAVPVYAVFTNEQLAAIVLTKARHKNDLRQVAGIGDGRLEKYGDRVIESLTSRIEQASQVVVMPTINSTNHPEVDPE